MIAAALEPLRSHTVLPPEDVGQLRRLMTALLAVGNETGDGSPSSPIGAGPAEDGDLVMRKRSRSAALVPPGGQAVDLPAALVDVLVDVARAMLAGRAVTISPMSRRLTTQEAADVLGVSRPTLVKLLERGEIPYERPGRHRRVRIDDLLEYQERRRAERQAVLSELTRTAQETGLYETSAADYREALQRARHAGD